MGQYGWMLGAPVLIGIDGWSVFSNGILQGNRRHTTLLLHINVKEIRRAAALLAVQASKMKSVGVLTWAPEGCAAAAKPAQGTCMGCKTLHRSFQNSFIYHVATSDGTFGPCLYCHV